MFLAEQTETLTEDHRMTSADDLTDEIKLVTKSGADSEGDRGFTPRIHESRRGGD
jgi:hypothetical protein